MDYFFRTTRVWLLLCRQLYEKFVSIYEVTQDTGYVAIPSSEMKSKVLEWMANVPTALEDVANQVTLSYKNSGCT